MDSHPQTDQGLESQEGKGCACVRWLYSLLYVHMACHWTMPWNGHHQTVRELVVVSPLTAKDT